MKVIIATTITILVLLSLRVSAQDDEVLNLSDTVTGNQEQPKVLYIVPWKQAEDETILYQPLNSQTNNIFSHIERREHQRQMQFLKKAAEDVK